MMAVNGEQKIEHLRRKIKYERGRGYMYATDQRYGPGSEIGVICDAISTALQRNGVRC